MSDDEILSLHKLDRTSSMSVPKPSEMHEVAKGALRDIVDWKKASQTRLNSVRSTSYDPHANELDELHGSIHKKYSKNDKESASDDESEIEKVNSKHFDKDSEDKHQHQIRDSGTESSGSQESRAFHGTHSNTDSEGVPKIPTLLTQPTLPPLPTNILVDEDNHADQQKEVIPRFYWPKPHKSETKPKKHTASITLPSKYTCNGTTISNKLVQKIH